MKTNKQYKMIKEWDNTTKESGKPLKDDDILFLCLLSMIPLIGQLYWISLLFRALKSRKVRFKEV